MSRNPKTVMKENALLKAQLAELTAPVEKLVERTWCYPCGGSGRRYRGMKVGHATCPDCGGSGKA